jgi:ADP-ribosylglycohydrolase
MNQMKNKVLGGVFGQALGDAWAMPALLTPKDTWDYYKGWFTDFYPGPDSHPFHHGMPPARVTDDTEQAYALAEEILREGKVSIEGTARAVINWYDRIDGDNSPYVGPSTRRAVLAMRRGVDLQLTGRFGDTNGASMRILPVGLIHPGDVEGAVRDAYLSCVPTHHTDVAVSGASAIAGALAMAMIPGTSIDELVEAGMRAADLGRAYEERWIGASISRRIRAAVEIARSPLSELDRLQEIYDLLGATVMITESVPAAFAVLVMADGDPLKTATYAAQLSGDADTIGAMGTAIAGTWRGIEAIPEWVQERLRKANPEMDFDWLADGLFKLAQASGK